MKSKKNVQFQDNIKVEASTQQFEKRAIVKHNRDTTKVPTSILQTKKTNKKCMKCTIDGRKYPTFTRNMIVGDSATSCHLFGDDDGMEDVVLIDKKVVGVNSKVHVTLKGKKKCRFKQIDGIIVERVLYPAKFVRGLEEPLFSITWELSNRPKITGNEKNNLVLKYEDGRDITFDCRI